MIYQDNKVTDLKIAFIGGGSRGWAWTLMNDLARAEDMAGTVYLYDIDRQASQNNAVIGNNFPGENWRYVAAADPAGAMTGADFVIVSILPGTFDEMESDVHAPEAFGIYQSVGDTAGPGGFVRALRTVPMMREIAANVRRYCPGAYVINYTNPMAVCIGALYREFPEIKAYGCCHEVFGTQQLLSHALEEMEGIADVPRQQMNVNVVGVNHFTWFTSAYYQGFDMFEVYRRFVDKYYESGYNRKGTGNWLNDFFATDARVRMDLFRRFGYIAAAGDRHLAEFMDFSDYLYDCRDWAFGLTPVSWRKKDLVERLARAQRLRDGSERIELVPSGEEGHLLMKALLGLGDMVSNVNIPNRGQIPNLPIGAVVETNALFGRDRIEPVFAGALPGNILPLVARHVYDQENTLRAAMNCDRELGYTTFINHPQMFGVKPDRARKLFDDMLEAQRSYLDPAWFK